MLRIPGVVKERTTLADKLVGNGSRSSDRATEAYEEIRALIQLGRLSPGTPIIQARMAKEIGQARATLRAALQRLAQEGYVVETELGTYSRFVVASLTVEDMQELFQIIGALEGVAARQCAGLPTPTREALAGRMEALNRRRVEMGLGGMFGPQDVNTLDTEFHQAFVTAANCARVQTQLASIRPQVERYRDLYLTHVTDQMRSLGSPEHQEIVDAIRSGDPERAQRAVELHWRAGTERMRAMIEHLGERRGYAG